MSVSLTRFSWWLLSKGKEKETKLSYGSSSESINITSFNNNKKDTSTNLSKKVKKKWNSREMMDKEYDVVLVPSDGVCLSEEEEDSSYDSDWSIGWMEPHAPDFLESDNDENDASFAVLVPCYKKAFKMDDDHDNIVDNGKFSAEGNKYMEQWIASLQNF